MRDLVRAAIEVQKVLDRKRWKYCFIGGIAVQKWGQVRLTRDTHLTIFTGIGDESRFINELLEEFQARIPLARDSHARIELSCCEPGTASTWMSPAAP